MRLIPIFVLSTLLAACNLCGPNYVTEHQLIAAGSLDVTEGPQSLRPFSEPRTLDDHGRLASGVDDLVIYLDDTAQSTITIDLGSVDAMLIAADVDLRKAVQVLPAGTLLPLTAVGAGQLGGTLTATGKVVTDGSSVLSVEIRLEGTAGGKPFDLDTVQQLTPTEYTYDAARGACG